MKIIALLAALTLAGCGGGSSDAPAPPPAPAPAPAPAGPPPCVPKVVTVAMLGDSTQLGYNGTHGLPTDKSPPMVVQDVMDAQFGLGAVIVTDYASSGTTAGQAPHVTADVIVENFGIPDMILGTPLDTYKANIVATGATIVETQSPLEGDPGWPELDYVDAARSIGLPVADVYAYVKSLPDPLSLYGDAHHPNNELYAMIATNVVAPAVAKQVAPLRCLPSPTE